MMVLILSNAPPSLTGRLTLWMFELEKGVYLSDNNAKLREWIWDTVCRYIGKGTATMVWSTRLTEFGFDMKTINNNKKEIYNLDGIKTMVNSVK